MIARLRHYRFDWKLSLLTALLLPLLVSLGGWQLQRETEKRELQNTYAIRQQEVPVDLAVLDTNTDLQYRQVALSGTFDNNHVFLLDNRVYQGQVGYEVVQPFTDARGLVVFVNRGWLAQGTYRAQLPAIEPVTGQVNLQGSVYVPVGEAFMLGAEAQAAGWPRIIQRLDPLSMVAQAGFEAAQLFPHTVRLAEGSPGVLTRYWPVVSTTPEKHRGYALQWFAMALALVCLYLYYSTRPPAEA